MQVSVDRKIYAPLVFCFAVVCALTFLITPATGSAGHNDDGGDQCISDKKALGVSQTKTFTVDGDDVAVTFDNHDDSQNKVNLHVDGTPVSVFEYDIGDGGADKGSWNSVSVTSPLEVRIPGATADGGGNIISISVEVHDTGCDDDDSDDGGGACGGNTATTTSVSEYFGELGVKSLLDCSGDQTGECNPTSSSNSKSASLDLDNVLGDGQTPGDLIVSFTSGQPHWSEGFTASINCEQDGYCNATAAITYPDDPNTLQRSVSTEFNTEPRHTVDNADDWIIEDIADTRNQITLETVASSSIGGSGDYDETAMADITVDDIQLQICDDGGGGDDLIPMYE